MPRVSVPDGQDPMAYLWQVLAPAVAAPATAFSSAAIANCRLSLREYEAARVTIAGINDCLTCLSWRSAAKARANADDPTSLPESFYEAVLAQDHADLTARERLCAEFASRYALDHRGMDDEFWSDLHEHFSDAEIVDLTVCTGACLAFGRLNRVLDIDGGCRVGAPAPH